jgi:hypothetical protein
VRTVLGSYGDARSLLRSLVAVICVGVVLGSGCSTRGSGPPPLSARPSARSSSVGPSATSPETPEWIAVLRVEGDPNDLDADTARLAPALGAAFRASPVQCFRGLPTDVGTGYLLGVVAGTRSELRRLVSRAGRRPLFQGRVEELCID